MRRRFLVRDYGEAGLEGQFADGSHVPETIDETTEAVVPGAGPVAIYLREVIPSSHHKLAYELWKTVHELPTNRSIAVGTKSLLRLTKDGSVGKRLGVSKDVEQYLIERGVAHGFIGSVDATSDAPCHKTRLTTRHPEMLEGNRLLIELVDGLYKEHAPSFHSRQRAEIEKVPLWRIWDTAFSTIYLARNFRTAYHRDSGNLKGVMTALMPMGRFTGGELVIPRWRIAFPLRLGDLLLFDPQQLHGNLPIQGERLSAAFYCEERIAEC
jgi:2-oxoglutarate-Fe(II)-dependent dioxygenase family protein